MAVPNIFGSATSAIPLSQLDTNFATAITIGNTAVYLGNTTTSLGNVTLTNVTISSGNVTVSNITANAVTSPSATNLILQSAGTTAVTIDTSQNVGIGVTPVSILHVKSASPIYTQETTGNVTSGGVAYQQFKDSTGIAFIQGFAGLNSCYQFGTNIATGFMRFLTGAGGEAMRIDSSGNVGIGTSSPSTYGKFAVVGADGYISASVGSTTALTQYISGDLAYICSAPSSGSNGKSMVFQTGTSGLGTERMRINTSGDIILGGSTVTTNPIGARVNGTALSLPTTNVNMIARSTSTQIALQLAGNSGQNIQFYTDNGSASVTAGTITSTGTATAYGVGTSDYRAKENVTNYTGGLSTITSLRPVSFTWKESQEQDIGFIAHEIQAVIPSTVYGEKDAVDEDGKPKMQTIFPSPPQMIANLVGAIQEQQALIQSLTTRITALETK
jgi:hypothetical protein